ncbi:hypothetical protein WA026_000375 [Henosepilachna vigintioctopunctata]|uniref:Fibroblast growth factor n=1 Tax=Henosepilachna vigintioctopunctata TaxID=420089 RepID=A0AAW1V095_9CUCU
MNCEKETSVSSSSDDDSDELDESVETQSLSREKRQIECGCKSNTYSNVQRTRKPRISWPPPSTSSGNWRGDLRHIHFGRPNYEQKMQLYCRTGYHLGIYHYKGVLGTRDENDLHTMLELVSAGFPGHVRIRGIATNTFVGMDKKGRLYSEVDVNEENTVFIESLQGSYNVYLSRKYAHLGWYIGIKKSGKFKRGPKTAYGQKAIQFLPRRHRF